VVEEARLSQQGSGLAPTGKGWFVVNVLETASIPNEHVGACCCFESGTISFPRTSASSGLPWR
jgi:hypothetical protein